MRVFRPGRDPLEVEVFRVVNVAEHPDLRAPALSGALQRLDDGELVAVPYVYHDPDAFQFILVIPEGGEGRELQERTRLLEALMQEPVETVPSYVRHFTLAYGHRGLAEQVDARLDVEVDVGALEPVAPCVSPRPRLHEIRVLPSAESMKHLATDLTVLVADGELWLFARLDETSMHSFSASASELRLQLLEVDHVPVCILTLVDGDSGATRRAYLNPDPAADAPVLEHLAREVGATLILSDTEGNMVRSLGVEAPIAKNAAFILDRTERAQGASPAAWQSAVDVVRRSVRTDDDREPPRRHGTSTGNDQSCNMEHSG